MKRFLLPLLVTIFAVEAYAIPAKPGLHTVKQPDGTELKVQLRGDERHHFYLTEDGYLLTQQNGTFCYADVDATGATVSSGIAATPAAARTANARAYINKVDMQRVYSTMTLASELAREAHQAKSTMRLPRQNAAGQTNIDKGLFSDASFPVHGEQKGLVILVEYKDYKFQLSDPKDYFTRMLNEKGFNDYGGTGSAKDFFELQSAGQFVPDFDVYGPVTLPNNRSYYGGNDYSGNDKNPEQMAVHACNLLDGEVDFSQYDRDGDGVIDNVFVFYAGQGEASYGSSETVWPHSWNVTYGDYTPHYYDGVLLDRYACSNEWEQGRPDGVGTFVHEFSHVMGLPDLYATSYTDAFTPGAWSCMDYGPYNNDGMTPPNYSAFERYALGWMEPKELSNPVSPTLRPITENIAGIVNCASGNEFFLFENRQQTGWDTYIPGHGMLVWHVHYVASVWDSNKVNNTSSHQYVDIEEADGSRSDYSRAGDCFPGTAGKTSFGPTTTPSIKPWSGATPQVSITNIKETPEGFITFDCNGGGSGSNEIPVPSVPEEIEGNSFTATWLPVEGVDEYYVNVYRAVPGTDGALYASALGHLLPGYKDVKVTGATSLTVSGLDFATEYAYTVACSDGWSIGVPSEPMFVHTLSATIADLTAVALPATEVGSEGFTASWQGMDDATDYLLSVFTRPLSGTLTEGCDFTDNVLPQGWSSSSGSFYASASYSATAVPSLRLGLEGDHLTTRNFTSTGVMKAIRFWHRATKADNATGLRISVLVDDAWMPLTFVSAVTASGGRIEEITDIPAGATAVRFTFVKGEVAAAIAIDDVAIDFAAEGEPEYVADYNAKPVGNTTEHTLSGLQPSTIYYYTVQATDGTLCSAVSAPVRVMTAEGANSAITGIAAEADCPAVYYNLQGQRVDNPGKGIYIVRTGTTSHKIIL